MSEWEGALRRLPIRYRGTGFGREDTRTYRHSVTLVKKRRKGA
jgi:hypothetical protein